jgi:hypothetical protein
VEFHKNRFFAAIDFIINSYFYIADRIEFLAFLFGNNNSKGKNAILSKNKINRLRGIGKIVK